MEEINNSEELKSFLRKKIYNGRKAEIELNRKWFFFLIRWIYFYCKLEQKSIEDIIEFRVDINNVKCKILLTDAS